MIKKITKQVVYPFIFALFPALSLFAHNISELNLDQLMGPVLLSIMIMTGLWAILSFFWQTREKTASLSCLLFLLFFSYGYIQNSIKDIGLNTFHLNSIALWQIIDLLPSLYVLISGILVLLVVYLIAKVKQDFWRISRVLNVVSLSALIMPITVIVIAQGNKVDNSVKLSPVAFNSTAGRQAKLPDIYYIIVDRYASAGSLEKYYKYDNSDFINFLKNKGFYVAENSKANYHFTVPSVASSLNMNYFDELIKRQDKSSKDEISLFEAVENNQVALYLKSKGYKYQHFGAPGAVTAKNKNADYSYEYIAKRSLQDPFFKLFLDEILLKPVGSSTDRLLGPITNGAVLESRRVNYETGFNEAAAVAETAKLEGPKFIFFHSLLTHPPYVLDASGNYLPEAVEASKSEKENYINQLIYSNHILKRMIERIFYDSKTPPVIILQSDEGPYPDIYRKKGDEFNWHAAGRDDLKQKFGILNAYYLPGADTKALYPAISPVNTFRVIFNQYFGEKLPILEDRSYAQVMRYYPYDVFEITDTLK